METGLKTSNGAQFQRHEVKEQGPVGLGSEAYEFSLRLRRRRIVDELQIRCLTAQARPVIDNLAIDFSRCVIDEGHNVGSG